MLTIHGGRTRYCDGINRRAFLKIGALAMGGSTMLTLPDVLRAESRNTSPGLRSTGRHKAVIMVYLGGGPPHQDTWEIKTDAPSEIRGEFQPIQTNVPGIEICEVFPLLAARMDKSAILRSIVGAVDRHEPYQCFSGWTPQELQVIGGHPCLGSAVSKLQGAVDPSVPAFVGLSPKTTHAPWGSAGMPGFLGPAYNAFQPDGPAMANMKLNGVNFETLQDRKNLLARFDTLRRDIDSNGQLAGVDSAVSQAFDVLTSSKLVDALDLGKEDPRIREKYGTGQPYKFQYDGAPTANDHFLIARRLVQAGARCVTLTFGRWDSHGDNFGLVRDHGAKLDQALSALIDDLIAHDMFEDVTVIAWGEFGRTPRINNNRGRDHWAPVCSAFLTGGGMKLGQAIGSTNRLGEYAKDRPVHLQEVVATLYHNLGIDVNTIKITDPLGRPQPLVERGPIRELIG